MLHVSYIGTPLILRGGNSTINLHLLCVIISAHEVRIRQYIVVIILGILDKNERSQVSFVFTHEDIKSLLKFVIGQFNWSLEL